MGWRSTLIHRVPIFLVILALSCCCLRAQQGPAEQDKYEAVNKATAELWKAKKYKQAIDLLLSLYNDGCFLDLPSDKRISTLYNLACGYSLRSEKAKSVAFLGQALAAGNRDYYELQGEK
jgi:hypothetical protein